MGRSMNGLVMLGAVLAVAGLIALAIPSFTTQQTNEVAHIGDLKLNATESTSHFIPPMVSAGVLLLGIVLLGAGLYRRS
jgi:uncharacterized membrane protein HdeD (DUF308 family)